MRNAIIRSCGSFVPDHIINNSYFNDLLGEDVDTWLREQVQITDRHWCTEQESTADLAEKAGHQALERGGISASDLDLIIVATDTPEYITPSTASKVQYLLGAHHAGSFDINSACASFVTGLDIGAKYIQADKNYQNVLVIGAYAMSKHLHLTDKKTVTLFADGAGAFLLQAAESDEQTGFLASELITEGKYYDWLGIFAGGTHQPVTQESIRHHAHQLKMAHKFPKELNPRMWIKMISTLCNRLNVQPQEVDAFFITQININSIYETLDRLEVPRKKAHTIMHRNGYTGSACIPMAFNDAWEKSLVNPGDLVFFIGSGGGLAFASAAFRL